MLRQSCFQDDRSSEYTGFPTLPFWGVPIITTRVFGGSILGSPSFWETTICPYRSSHLSAPFGAVVPLCEVVAAMVLLCHMPLLVSPLSCVTQIANVGYFTCLLAPALLVF